MQNNNGKTNQNKITGRITNPNFINKSQGSNFIKSGSINNSAIETVASKTILQKVKSARLTSVINISNMNLENLPPEIFDENLKFDDINWWQMVEIKKLDASNNRLTSENVVSDFSSIPSLNYLKFSFNNFTFIPPSIHNLTNLKFLDFSNNKINKLNNEIRNLNSLVDLNLSNNLLNEIPNSLTNLTELEVLNISNNKLKEIPYEFVKLKRIDISENLLTNFQIKAKSLEELIAYKNKLNEIDVSNLSNLVYLDIHNNFISEFTKIPNSNKLDTIVIGFNKLTKISNIKNASNLSVLDLNDNKLETLSDEILQLKELKTLNLMNNSINDLPPQLCFLKNLVRINLDGNPLKKINSKVRSSNAENIKAYLRTRLTEDDLKKISQDCLKEEYLHIDKSNSNNNISLMHYVQNNCLKINNESLTEIPVDNINKIPNMKYLSSLDLSYNKITNIDSLMELTVDYHKLLEMKEIRLSYNLIIDIPDIILMFRNLRIIDFKGNNLSSFCDFDDEFFTNYCQENKVENVLPFLEYMDLSINKLKRIPTIVKHLKNLSTLLLANNLISDIPEFCSDKDQKKNFLFCESLDTLDLGNNKIQRIYDKMYKICPNLKNFNLENNEIKIIPTDLCLMQNMSKLNLNGNPIKMLRSNILLAGTKSILEYLRKMHKFDEEDIRYDHKVNSKIAVQSTFNSLSNDDKMLVDEDNNELDKINMEILQIESDLNGSLPVYKKTELRKKLNALIRLRANLMK